MNDDLEFRVKLKDLKTLSNAVCELDAHKPPRDVRINELISGAHAAIIRTLGAQVALLYGEADGSEQTKREVEGTPA